MGAGDVNTILSARFQEEKKDKYTLPEKQKAESIVAIPILKNKCVNKLHIELQPLERIVRKLC